MITLSECGSFPDPDNLVSDGAAWSWYMPWYGNYTTSATYNSIDLWKKTFSHSYVITLDKMPSLKSVSYTHLDVYKRQVGVFLSILFLLYHFYPLQIRFLA